MPKLINDIMTSKKMAFKNWVHNIRFRFRKATKKRKSPHAIAFGFYIGTLLNLLLPIIGISWLVAIFIAFISRKISRAAMFLALVFWNVITLPPVYMFSYSLGNLLFGSSSIPLYTFQFMGQTLNITKEFLIGHIISTFIISLSSYFILKSISTIYYKKIAKKPVPE